MKQIYGVLIGIVIGCLVLGYFGKKHYDSKLLTVEQLMNDTINYYKTEKLKSGQIISTQAQTITTMKNAIEAGLVEKKELKELGLKKDVTIIRLEKDVARYKLEASYVHTDTTVVHDTIIDNQGYIKVPQEFIFRDAWMQMHGTIKLTGVTIDSLHTIIKPTYYLGYQRQGLFKPLKPTITAKDENPYVSTTDMQNIVIQDKKPIYKTAWWHRAEGAAAFVGLLELIKFLK